MIQRRFDNLKWKLRPKEVVTINGSRPCVLYSYLHRPLTWNSRDDRFNRHSNSWESVEIARLLKERGYSVDAIDWQNATFRPQRTYEVVFDIGTNMQNFASLFPQACKLFHLTGSHAKFQNAAEAKRAAAFEERTGIHYALKRAIKDPDASDRSLRCADRCSLIGNMTTLRTYPEDIRSRTSLVTVSSSPGHIKPPSRLLSQPREFLWFFGSGAVHKGLDLVLEAFRKIPRFTLNVVGHVDWENDFMRAYGDDLRRCPNVRYHGSVDPSGARYRKVVERCVAFVAPSCSEGISPAATTVMRTGLYPIISRETGMDLPEGHGTYLQDCSIDEIVQVCQDVMDESEATLQEDIAACQAFALRRYSREAFSSEMRSYLTSAIGQPKDL